MKKMKSIIYGLCIFWDLFVCATYMIVIVLDGVKNVGDYSLDSGYLFVTMIATMIVIVKYPVSIWAKRVVAQIKKEFKNRQKAQQNKNTNGKQVKAA